jgi:hypothetical protein
MADSRTAGLRGRLPVKPPGQRFNIQYLSAYLKEPLPAPSYPVDVSGGITDWGMLGNGPDPTLHVHGGQPVGDCTFAGRQHLRMAKAAAAAETETWETTDQLVTEYLQYDHGKDEGANIADLLLSWYNAKRILAFAPVDHTDAAECDSTMAAFHGLYVGVNLTDDADALFGKGEAWTTANGEQPDPNDGHCIVKVKSDGQQTDTWVTWGALQPSTLAWTSACLDEAWAVVTTEDQAATINMPALLADINALGGTGGGAGSGS